MGLVYTASQSPIIATESRNFVSILQRSEMPHREIKWFAHRHTADEEPPFKSVSNSKVYALSLVQSYSCNEMQSSWDFHL